MNLKTLTLSAASLGAVLVMAGPAVAAQAATATLSLSSNAQPVTVQVNGRSVTLDGGYEATPVTVNTGSVSLSAAARVSLGGNVCYGFDSWSDGNRSRSRSITVRGNHALHVYYSRAAC